MLPPLLLRTGGAATPEVVEAKKAEAKDVEAMKGAPRVVRMQEMFLTVYEQPSGPIGSDGEFEVSIVAKGDYYEVGVYDFAGTRAGMTALRDAGQKLSASAGSTKWYKTSESKFFKVCSDWERNYAEFRIRAEEGEPSADELMVVLSGVPPNVPFELEIIGSTHTRWVYTPKVGSSGVFVVRPHTS